MKKTNGKVLKRVCTLALSAALVAGSLYQLPNGVNSVVEVVSAGDGYDGAFNYDGREYHYTNNKNDNNITLVCVIGTGDIKVPSEVKINGKTRKITGLNYPFGHLQTANSFTIPDSVTTIGNNVFTESTINRIKLPDTLKSIGANFCEKTTIGNVICNSKKVTIGSNPFKNSTITVKKLIINDWLFRYTPDKNILNLNNYELENIKHALNGAIRCGSNVKVLQIGKNETLLNRDYYYGGCQNNFEKVYVNGTEVHCKNADDTVPDIMKRHYELFEYGAFELKYATEKANHILGDMGITCYGPNRTFFKGTLSAAKEYEIALKVHDYIVKNYVYDVKAKGLYTRVFNCHTVSKCQFDAEIYAFLLENAGVETEVVYSQEYKTIDKDRKKYLEENDPSKLTSDGFELGFNGKHAWNTVKIGGKLYYVDTTNDRENNFYWFFLFTNDSINRCMKENSWQGHWYPRYENYNDNVIDDGKLFSFQTKKTRNKDAVCNTYFGDVDKNRGLYISDNDVKVLSDYLNNQRNMTYDETQLDVNFDKVVDKADLKQLERLAGPVIKK